MTVKEIMAYQCGYCTRCFVKKGTALWHESHCNNNPIRKNCKTCVHGVYEKEKTDEPEATYYNLELHQEIPIYSAVCKTCDYHNMAMRDKPYNIDCEYCETDEYSEHEAIPKAGTCEHYEYKGKAKLTRKDGADHG